MDLIIKNGTVVNAAGMFPADIAVENGVIKAIDKNIKCACRGVNIIDAKGKLVMPGGIDAHTHFNLPACGTYSEGWETGTAAAACGGVTTVMDFAYQSAGKSLKKAIAERKKDANRKICIDYSLHGGITDWNDNSEKEMKELVKDGISSFKMCMCRRNGRIADDGVFFQALEITRQTKALLMVHAENGQVLELLIERYRRQTKKIGVSGHALSRPGFIEYEAIQRAIIWAEATGGRLYIVHVSTGKGAEAIRQAKKRGVNVWAETCPQYLLLTDEVFKRKNGHLFATCPQIKKNRDKERLWKGLTGGEIQVLATDTCGFTKKQKALWKGDFTKIPYGISAVELLIPAMWTACRKRKISANKFVSLVSTNPAKLFGLYPRKGTIKIGSDADIIIFDPEKRVNIDSKNLTSKCGWTPFQGIRLKGYQALTISRGEVIAENGKFTGKPGRGKFLKQKTGGRI